MILFHYCIDVRIVPSKPVVVQSVAHDEVVGDLHGYVFDVQVHLQFVRFHQQGGDVYLLRVTCAEGFNQALHGETRVHDVFHDDYRAVRQVLVDADHLFDDSCGRHALVGRQLDERDFTRDGDAFHQVGGEHERTVQHAEEERVLSCQVTIDFIGHAGHFFQNVCSQMETVNVLSFICMVSIDGMFLLEN